MAPADALAVAPIGKAVTARPDGLRVVTRENGRYIDLMPSPLSSYLLPPLADSSLVRREALSPTGALRFRGDVVELVEEVDDRELNEFLSGMSETSGMAGVAGVGAIGGSFALALLAAFVAFRVLRRAVPDRRTAIGPTPPSPDLPLPDLSPVPATPTPEFSASTRALTSNDVSSAPLSPDAPVFEVASRIAALSGLSDELLAELFKVERETFCRWRTGVLGNPRVGNRRRLGLVLTLLTELAEREVNIRDWLLNFTTPEGLTPYQLLDQGRLGEVAFLAASIGEGAAGQRDARVATGEDSEPLQFGDDDVWDLQTLDDHEH